MNYWAMWLMVVILLTILEFATVNLVSVWFIVSGILALILSLFVDSLAWQFGVFVLVGILLMILTKPLLDKMMNKDLEKLNLERVIGMPGIVTEEIKPGRVGEVKVDGKLWSATSSEELAVDTMILVEKMEGVKLSVVRNEPEEVSLPQEIEVSSIDEEPKSDAEISSVENDLTVESGQETNTSIENDAIKSEENSSLPMIDSPVIEESKENLNKNEMAKPKNHSSKKRKRSNHSSSNKKNSKNSLNGKGVNE